MPNKGLEVRRLFTQPGENPLKTVKTEKRNCKITKTDGSVVFEMNGFEVPVNWSQNAGDIMISKYARKAGVPQYDEKGEVLKDASGKPQLGPEKTATQVVGRLLPARARTARGRLNVRSHLTCCQFESSRGRDPSYRFFRGRRRRRGREDRRRR